MDKHQISELSEAGDSVADHGVKYAQSRDQRPIVSDTKVAIIIEKTELASQIDPLVDGGLRGWLTVAGSWLILFACVGSLYAFGVYQDYYTRVFLRDISPSKIAWTGSTQLALPHVVGYFAGRLFDAGHIRLVFISGSVIFTLCLFMLSLAHEGQYYQVFLPQGLGLGIGTGFLFTPANAIVGLHFRKRRSLAIGIATTGISIGGVILPIVLNHVIPRVGFAEGVRITAYMVSCCLVLGNCLIRVPARDKNVQLTPPDIRQLFKDPPYVACVLGVCTSALGVFLPSFYLQLYAVQHSISNGLAFYSLAILNGSAVVGRLVGNLLADSYGVWNIQVPVTLVTGATIWAMLGINNEMSLIVVSALYGATSGSWLSLTLSALTSLATNPGEIGVRSGLALAIGSPAFLVSGPIQGALLTRNFHWTAPIAFSGAVTMSSAIMYLIVRMHTARKKGTQRV